MSILSTPTGTPLRCILTGIVSLQAPEILRNKAFIELLAFQRGQKFKDSDIEFPNTAIKHIKERAEHINNVLSEELQVCTFIFVCHTSLRLIQHTECSWLYLGLL